MQLKTLLSALEQPPINVLSALTEKSGRRNVFNEEREITSLAYDSRQVQPGGLFIAVPGDHTDGRRFLQDAAQRGAYAALGVPLEVPARSSLPLPYIEVQDVRIALANLACTFYRDPSAYLCTFGVTGTDGKTTTSNLISTILETAGFSTGLMTTANFKISGQEWDNATRQSTLEALEVQQFLRRMLMLASHTLL